METSRGLRYKSESLFGKESDATEGAYIERKFSSALSHFHAMVTQLRRGVLLVSGQREKGRQSDLASDDYKL